MMTNKNITIMVISILLMPVLFSGCIKDAAQNKETDPARNLYKYRSEYIGDSSNTSALAGALPYGEYKKGIELSTADKPYGLKVIYNINEADVNMTDLKEEFYNNALIIFSLIGNVDNIDFIISNQESVQPQTHQYNRELIEESAISDLFSYSKDEETFSRFLSEKVYTAGDT